MSRRGRSGPTISLFSFQDIITSVTAIVMVITLLLAVDLVQRKRSEGSDSSGDLAADIVRRLEQLQRELASLKAAASASDEIVREVSAMSPAEIQNELAHRQSAISQLRLDEDRLRKQEKELIAAEKRLAAEQFDLEPLRQKTKTLDRTTADLERQLQEDRKENRVVFSLPRGFQKDGWLAVTEADRIVVAPIGRASKPIEFRAQGIAFFSKDAAQLLEAWIDEQTVQSAYFLLLVRPDASDTFNDVESMLAKRSISHGFDLIANDAMILHPERGAAP